MKVYVESNFLLELTLSQEQHESCEKIVELCVTGRHSLALPAFCIPESFYALVGKARTRIKLAKDIQAESGQLSRSSFHLNRIVDLDSAAAILSRSVATEEAQFHSRAAQFLRHAILLPLDAVTLDASGSLRATGVMPQYFDSLVLASVLNDLRAAKSAASCFLNRNRSDFDDPQIVAMLAELGCTILFNFDDGLAYLTSQTS
jgi:predicted nucleic acid-binding protein